MAMNRMLLIALAASLGPSFAQEPGSPPPVAAPASAIAKSAPSPVLNEPSDAELLPPKHEVHGEARVQQIRKGNRVDEIVVTPAGQTYSYTIMNREAQRPISPSGMPSSSSALSIPTFFKFEF
jgi:hypothetical protein